MKKKKLESLDGPMNLDKQLCFAVYTASRLLIQAYEPILKKFDLTYTQYIVMLALDPKHAIPMKELGQKLFLDSGTLSPLLKKMEKRGILNRSDDPLNERKVLIELTNQGKKLRSELTCVAGELVESLGSEVSLDELAQTRDSLSSLINVLGTH